jgi:anti-sigma factor (TIGR02949 family)
MNCDSVRDQLNAYVDGELPAETVQHVEEHLKTCDECSEWVEEEEGIGELVKQQRVPDPPDTLKSGVMQAVSETEKGGPSSRRVSFGGAFSGGRMAAGAMFLVGLVLGLAVQIIALQYRTRTGGAISEPTQKTKMVMDVRPTGSLSELLIREPQQRTGGQP